MAKTWLQTIQHIANQMTPAENG